MQKEILKNKGEKVVLLGNEAIVRGALESGVQFISTYPGTPASEIGNIFYQLFQSKKLAKNIYFDPGFGCHKIISIGDTAWHHPFRITKILQEDSVITR